MGKSDAKWKESRIVFDIAEAFKSSGGKVSLDEAVLMAATPSVTIDFANTPNEDLKRIMQEMKRFLKSNSRFRSFTKVDIAKGLQREWLPSLEEDDKLRFLSDIRFITNVDEQGFIDVNRQLLEKFTTTSHTDTEKYGSDSYSPKPSRKSGSKQPKKILTSVERDLNLAVKLKPYIEWYKKYWKELQEREDYKWIGLIRFQQNFNLESDNFAQMLADSFEAGFNLLAARRFYNPLGGIKKIAKFAPNEVREAFRVLFDCQANIAHRVETFIKNCDEISLRLVSEGKITETNFDKQSERSASVFLSFYYPSDYFLYKYSLWQDFKNQTDVNYPSLTYFESKLTGYQMICEQIREVLMMDGELMEILNTTHPDDPSDCHLLTQDFLYCIANHFVDFNSAPREDN